MPPVPTAPRSPSSSGPYDRPNSMKGHLPEHLVPKKPGHQYSNNCMVGSKVDQQLRQMLQDIEPEVIDYDLAVTLFLYEASHLPLPNIPRSADIIIQDYQIRRALTSRQAELLTCAKHTRSIIDLHLVKPGPIQLFALCYPNIKALDRLTIERSKAPRTLASNRSHVLVDLAGGLLAISLLPSKKIDSEASSDEKKNCRNTDDPSPEVRVLNALEGAVKVHGLPCFNGRLGEHFVNLSPFDSC